MTAPRVVDLPCTLHGGTGDPLWCMSCQADPLPQGETAGDELDPNAAMLAMCTNLALAGAPASKVVSVREVTVTRAGRWVALAVSWVEGRTTHHATIRMNSARARVLAARLNKVVE